MYAKYLYNFHDESHVEFYNLEFKSFFKKHLEKMGNPDLITEWKINMDKDDYLKQTKDFIII